MRHCIALVSDSLDKSTLYNFEDVKRFSEQNTILTTRILKEPGNPEPNSLYLIPFLTRGQLNSLHIDDKILILTLSPYFFAILTNDKIVSKEILFSLNGSSNLIYEGIPIQSVILEDVDNKLHVEMPNCPLCLKRIDKVVTGLNTMTCRDLFHSCCQDKCKIIGQNCYVCSQLHSSKTDACLNCGSLENIWICLICSNVGCGRYKGGHAHNHYIKTGHAFVIKADSHHIWDYSLDRYVHWTIKSSEGIVAVDQDSTNTTYSTSAISAPDADNTNFLIDFTAAQFESQKAFYEDRIRAIRATHQLEISEANELHKKENLFSKSDISAAANEKKILTDLSHQLQEQNKKLKAQVANLSNELETERKLSQGLLKTVDSLQATNQTNKSDKEELQEQVKDLMKHIEILDLMSQAGNDPDIVDGKILIRPPPPSSNNGHKKKSK